MSDDLVRRLRNPPFGTESSERNLMASAADALDTQAAEIARLRAELATARREGMEEAAKIADRCTPRGHEGYDGAYNRGINTGTMQAKADIAAAIRAAAKEGKP